MMRKFDPCNMISMRRCTLGQLMSGPLRLAPAGFQRAYAWEVENAERLLEGVTEAMRKKGNRRWYYLGALTLVRKRDGDIAAIADGQQRLVTLSILFALLRDLEPDEAKRTRLRQLLYVDGGASGGAQVRLTPQQDIAATFRAYVQDPLATMKPVPESELEDLPGSATNVIENRDALRAMLAPFEMEHRRAIADFLADNCIVGVNEVTDEEDAREIFSVAHTTGIQLRDGDLFKVDVLSCVPQAERDGATAAWNEWQSMLGPDHLHRLFESMRVLRKRVSRPADSVYADLWSLYDIDKRAGAFVRDDFVPMARLYGAIVHGTIGAGDPVGDQIRRRLQYLEWMPYRDWMGPLLHWLRSGRRSAEETLQFLKCLDRLAYTLCIISEQTSRRHERYIRVLGDIDARRAFDRGRHLDVSPEERKQMRARLSGRSLQPRRWRSTVLRRIDAALLGDLAPVDFLDGNIEHILPKNPPAGSPWLVSFPREAERADHVDMLGNLALLSHADNGAVRNGDFELKRRVLAASEFALAREAGARGAWNAAMIRQRTSHLIKVLERSWDEA